LNFKKNLYICALNLKNMDSTQEFKLSIAALLPEIDDSNVLEACQNLMERYLTIKKVRLHQEKVFGYGLNGEKLNIAILEKELIEAMSRMKEGKGISQKNLEQMVNTW
jgi:bifunctional pyridoxal-dependent enzyme with beta-cystathionase and maltose regulon repressor activities